jgi:hypothetical protein
MTPDHWRKYPRTLHHPSSPGIQSDDKIATDLSALNGAEVIMTEKMDGENTTLYSDGFHARSLDSISHPARSWLASFHGQIAHMIPQGWRICGENLYARHAIGYDNLPGFFMAFSVWTDQDHCLDVDTAQTLLDELHIPAVRQLYRGPYSEAALTHEIRDLDPSRQEGIVIRTAASFPFQDFGRNVIKWVRAGHVQSADHWRFSQIVPNGLNDEGGTI